jgi:hydroxymethylbilane synthase
MPPPIRIGTRGSALALWQARKVAGLLEASGARTEIVVIRTSGDERQGPPDAPGTNVKRMFVKELEEALIERHVEVAVHSSKDLPGALPEELIIGAALERDDPRDAILVRGEAAGEWPAIVRALGATPSIGTTSVRRIAQLRTIVPQATFTPLRGNVDTRLRKLDAGECTAVVLASAGLLRLGLGARITAPLPIETCVPAPGQGIIAVQLRADADARLRTGVARISDADAEAALVAERAVVNALGGGCQMPLGAIARIEGQSLEILGLVASLDGRTVVRATVRGNRGGAAAAGEKLAARLLAQGAAAIIDAPHGR